MNARLGAALALAAALALPACDARLEGGAVFVDAESIGGRCSDARARTTVAKPVCSLSRGAELARGGDTVLVRRGAYGDFDLVDERRGRYVTVRPYDGEAVEVAGIDVAGSSHWRFTGLRITDHSDLTDDSEHLQFVGNEHVNKGVKATHSIDHVLFQDNWVHDLRLGANAVTAVGFWAGGDPAPTHITFRNNRFERLPNDALFLSGSDFLVEDNEMIAIDSPDNDRAHADTIQTQGASRLTIRGNVAVHNDSGILSSGGGADSARWRVYNNSFSDIESWPWQVNNSVASLHLANNTFGRSGADSLFRWDSAHPVNRRGWVVVNNVFDHGVSFDRRLRLAAADYNLKPGRRRGRHDLVGRASFVDPVSDLRLAPGSRGIDAGTGRFGVPRSDLAGRARPADDPAVRNRGSAFDVGAHERLGRAGPPAPAPALVRAPAVQHVRRGAIVLAAACPRRCRIGARAVVRTRGGRVASRRLVRPLGALAGARMSLGFAPADRRLLARAGGPLRGSVAVTARSGPRRWSGVRRFVLRR